MTTPQPSSNASSETQSVSKSFSSLGREIADNLSTPARQAEVNTLILIRRAHSAARLSCLASWLFGLMGMGIAGVGILLFFAPFQSHTWPIFFFGGCGLFIAACFLSVIHIIVVPVAYTLTNIEESSKSTVAHLARLRAKKPQKRLREALPTYQDEPVRAARTLTARRP